MNNIELTTETISTLKVEDTDNDIIKKLIEIVEGCPDDLLRVFARVWLAENSVKLLKRNLDL